MLALQQNLRNTLKIGALPMGMLTGTVGSLVLTYQMKWASYTVAGYITGKPPIWNSDEIKVPETTETVAKLILIAGTLFLVIEELGGFQTIRNRGVGFPLRILTLAALLAHRFPITSLSRAVSMAIIQKNICLETFQMMNQLSNYLAR
jgi:hypothetical protein